MRIAVEIKNKLNNFYDNLSQAEKFWYSSGLTLLGGNNIFSIEDEKILENMRINSSYVTDRLLSSIKFNYTYAGTSYVGEGIFDLFPYIPHPQTIPHFRNEDEKEPIVEEQKLVDEMLDKLVKNNYAYNGYIKYIASNEDKTIKEIQPGLYVFGFGYLVWDAVRMINWTLNELKIGRRVPKLNRYIRKYYDLLEAINHPEFYINCDSWKEFVEKCKGQ